MSQPIISFRHSVDSGYDDTVVVYLDDMTEEQQNDDSGEVWGTMIVDWSASTNVRVDLAGYSPAEAADLVDNVDSVVEDWLDLMASGTLDWDIADFNIPNESVRDVLMTEIDFMLTTPERALATYLDDSDALEIPEHLADYRGVIYERMADDMIANGEAVIGDAAIFHNA